MAPALERQPEQDVQLEQQHTAVDERQEKLDDVHLRNACNMATLAWLFNPTNERDAVGIPKWE
jgi:hypothetical protein